MMARFLANSAIGWEASVYDIWLDSTCLHCVSNEPDALLSNEFVTGATHRDVLNPVFLHLREIRGTRTCASRVHVDMGTGRDDEWFCLFSGDRLCASPIVVDEMGDAAFCSCDTGGCRFACIVG